MTTGQPDKRAARDAHQHADILTAQVEQRWPGAFAAMDESRRARPVDWPDWCLLPMAAAAAVVTADWPPPPIAAVSALYAWRYSRACYLIEPGLTDRLLGQVPDDYAATGVEVFSRLPHWCVYVAESSPEWPGAGFWAHLEHDVNTGRPELRLLVDLGGDRLGQQMPIPVYLDRPSLTEALADFRATAQAQLTAPAGADVRGGDLDAGVAKLADRVDGYLSILAYLCRPEADVVCVGRSGVTPVRPRSPVRDRTTWAVGYNLLG